MLLTDVTYSHSCQVYQLSLKGTDILGPSYCREGNFRGKCFFSKNICLETRIVWYEN